MCWSLRKTTNMSTDVPEIPEYTREELKIPPTRDTIENTLNRRQLKVYNSWRLDFSNWAHDRGKEPEFYEGYSIASMRNIISRIETFCLWLYQSDRGFTTDFRVSDVDAYWNKVLKPKDSTKTRSDRRTINNVSLVLKHQGIEYKIPKSKEVHKRINKKKSNSFTDWLRPNELKAVRDASLEAYYIPPREDHEPGEQEKYTAKLAQTLRKPKNELTDEDWAKGRSWKIPSIVYVSRDVGFRPTEIEKSNTNWLVLKDKPEEYSWLKIPKDEDSKEGENDWSPILSNETVRILKLWLDERKEDPAYDDRDEIWLNREGNQYNADSLGDIMFKLMETAGIDTDNRETGWYMMRRGVGTELGNAEGISAVMSQLRIKREETARRYILNDDESTNRWMENR